MFSSRVLAVLTLLVCTVPLAVSRRARAQAGTEEKAAETSASVDVAASADSPPAAPNSTDAETAQTGDKKKKKKPPMEMFAIGVQLGYASVGTGDVKNPTYLRGAELLTREQLVQYGLVGTEGCTPVDKRCRTEARRGFHLSIPLQIGGAGIGYRLEPYFTFASNAKAYGIYTGPTFEFHVIDPLYLGFGFGLKAAWVKADDWKYAADVYGRIPMHATWYLIDDLAVVFEFAFGAGASGYVSELKDVINPQTGRRIARRTDVTFGFGRTWDLSLGLRFP